jgi:ATP-dependent exoDNAse (exonuclease V) beta subunit
MLPAVPPRAQWEPPPDRARIQDEIEFSWAGETARHVGSVVHRWLQRIADDQMKGWDAQRITGLRTAFARELLARGISNDDLDTTTARVVSALTQAVTDERGRWLLGAQREAHNEHRITAIVNGERMDMVIDRTFIANDDRHWIVDYKTSSHEGTGIDAFLDSERERYEAQLMRYALALAYAGDTMLGLYFPLLSGWREWK